MRSSIPCTTLHPLPFAPTGGDSGIGRAVAVRFAREGADVAIVYLDEHKDAEETVALVEKERRKALKFAGDVGQPEVGPAGGEGFVWQFRLPGARVAV